jgi:hypothetical protein
MRTALAVAAAIGSLPHAALFVPGRSLGGVQLGEPAKQVRAALGAHGTCENCATPTWYFNYRKFTQPGLAVEFSRGRVAAVYTVWRPAGWHTRSGLVLGAVEGQVTKLAGPLLPMECLNYSALVRDTGAARSAYYVVDGKLWGFGLMPARTSPCR